MVASLVAEFWYPKEDKKGDLPYRDSLLAPQHEFIHAGDTQTALLCFTRTTRTQDTIYEVVDQGTKLNTGDSIDDKESRMISRSFQWQQHHNNSTKLS
ncbi:predicted protein [Lichtheimia corymbifera JMRC:FSU:9682]|uniref:Uncharacterized protein n=1 Tax=Lichtheimia corymbifera JMRC:FSU:9682 TaxID=1263082 RepID=A0A068REK2_9FUNG|nr:predicted protein [Lichtheimia corymbifera JMRC:FSU:9682]